MSGPTPVVKPVVTYDPFAQYERDGVKRFLNTRLQDDLDSILKDLKPEETVAVVAHHAYHHDGERIENVTKLSAVVRTPIGGLSLLAGAFKDWTKKDAGIEGMIVYRR